MPYCDYRQIAPECTFGVYAPHKEEGVESCGEPAIYKVWWDDKEEDFLNVCQAHFDEIVKQEDKMIDDEKKAIGGGK